MLSDPLSARVSVGGSTGIPFRFRGVAQPGLARQTGGLKVAGSNPVAPTWSHKSQPMAIRAFMRIANFFAAEGLADRDTSALARNKSCAWRRASSVLGTGL